MKRPIKIIKIKEDVFKHIVGIIDPYVFYNSKATRIRTYDDMISVNSGYSYQNFGLDEVEVYDIGDVDPIAITSMEEFVQIMNDLNYPLLRKGNVPNSFVSITVPNRIPDPTQDLIMEYGDGTVQTIFFTADGDFAGRTKRV